MRHNIIMSVAILLEDLREVRKLSRVFKQIGVIPHYHLDLRSFWDAVLIKRPSLCVVDVGMMDGRDGLVLKNHPRVKDNGLPLVFYYTDKDLPFLSTTDIFNYGLLNQSSHYQGQLKSILNRFNHIVNLEQAVERLEDENSVIDGQRSRLLKTVEKQREQNTLSKTLQELSRNIELAKRKEDFLVSCLRVLGDLPFVSKMAAAELDESKTKLLSPLIRHPKYRSLPPLWLGQNCRKGIEFFAQSMANQVVLELFGEKLMPLLIRGVGEGGEGGDTPQKMVFLCVEDADFLAHFDWGSLERQLNGLYAHFELRSQRYQEKKGRLITPWELYSCLDQVTFQNLSQDFTKNSPPIIIEGDCVLIDLHFSKLLSAIGEMTGEGEARFHWRKFFFDFLARMEAGLKGDFQVVCLGVEHLALLAPRPQKDSFFAYLKSFSEKFPYWRYFENNDAILAKDMAPLLHTVPFSREAYYGQILKEIGKNIHEASNRTSSQLEATGRELHSP